MARELLAPVAVQQRLFDPGHGRGVDDHAGETAIDHAAVGVGTGRCGADIVPVEWVVGVEPSGPDTVLVHIVGVEDVEVRPRRVGRIDGQPQHAPIPETVDLDRDIDHQSGGGVVQIVVRPDEPILLAHEDLAVGCEADADGLGMPSEDRGLCETRGKCRHSLGHGSDQKTGQPKGKGDHEEDSATRVRHLIERRTCIC